MHLRPLPRLIIVVGIVLAFIPTTARARPITVQVRADLFFNPTGILASPGEMFSIQVTGSVNLAIFDGPYITDPNGTILVAPSIGSGAYNFFTNSAGPIGVPPMVGSQKTIVTTIQQGHAFGGPYGDLVAGFSLNPNPTSFADFSTGFAVIGASGLTTAPATGGFLTLAANDTDNIVDNAGSFTAQVSQAVAEPSTIMLLGIGIPSLLVWRRWKRG